MELKDIVAGLRNSPYVKEKELGNGISSFNFTRKAFWDHHWTDMSVKARGLFIDTENMVVRARSYDKFFNLGERRDTELDYIKNNSKSKNVEILVFLKLQCKIQNLISVLVFFAILCYKLIINSSLIIFS